VGVVAQCMLCLNIRVAQLIVALSRICIANCHCVVFFYVGTFLIYFLYVPLRLILE